VFEVGAAADARSLLGAHPATEESQRELILIFSQHSTSWQTRVSAPAQLMMFYMVEPPNDPDKTRTSEAMTTKLRSKRFRGRRGKPSQTVQRERWYDRQTLRRAVATINVRRDVIPAAVVADGTVSKYLFGARVAAQCSRVVCDLSDAVDVKQQEALQESAERIEIELMTVDNAVEVVGNEGGSLKLSLMENKTESENACLHDLEHKQTEEDKQQLKMQPEIRMKKKEKEQRADITSKVQQQSHKEEKEQRTDKKSEVQQQSYWNEREDAAGKLLEYWRTWCLGSSLSKREQHKLENKHIPKATGMKSSRQPVM